MTSSKRRAVRPLLALAVIGGACFVAGSIALVVALAWPESAPPTEVRVIATASGVDAADIESLLARPIANALGELELAQRVSTRSTRERAIVTCELAPDQDLFEARVAIAERLRSVELPDYADVPVLHTPPRAGTPERVFTVSQDAREPLAQLRVRLLSLAGVAEVELCGERERALRVELDPDRMAAHGLGLRDVLAALRTNEDLPAGRLELGAHELALRTGSTAGVEGLRDRVLRMSASGVPVRLSEVATIADGYSPPTCRAWRSGEGATVAGHVRLSAPDALPQVDATLREHGSARPLGEGAPVTRGVVLVTPGASPEERWRLVEAVGRSLSSVGGVRDVLLDDGELPGSLRASIAWDGAPSSEAVRAAVAAVPGAVLVPDDALRVRIVGPGRAQLLALAGRACEVLERDSGVRACVVLWSETTELSIAIDRERAARHGVSMAELTDALAAASDTGLVATSWYDGAERIDVLVRLGSWADGADLPRTMIATSTGAVPLSELASLTPRTVPTALETLGGTPAITIAVSVDSASVEDVANVLDAELGSPPGVHIEPPAPPGG